MSSGGNLNNLQVPDFVFKDNPACAETDPELFFPQEITDSTGNLRSKYYNLAAAKKICDGCPLKMACLEYALNNIEIGVWGGTTEEQRNLMRRRIGAARRARKTPSPDVW